MNEPNLTDNPINIEKSIADSRSLIMPHQQEAVDALNKYFDLSGEYIGPQNGLLVMPTGSGKTFTAVHWLLKFGVANGYRILWLAHRQELIDQTNREFRKQTPILAETSIKKISVFPVSGMHYHMSMTSRREINICSIASIANKFGYRYIKRMLGETGKEKVIVVIDEAHHAIASNYQKVLKRITELNPNRILIGLTATPTRMQPNDITKLYKMFNVTTNRQVQIGTPKGFVYEVTLKQLLTNGFLAKPIYEKVNTNINGEIEYLFSEEDEKFFEQYGELSEAIKTQIAKSSVRNQAILDQYLKNKDRYKKTLIFAVNQLHAETLFQEFTKSGVSCDYVISNKEGTQKTIQDFKNNKIDVLINVQILTEGSDVPDIQTVFLTRETNSDSLLMQMIGRGLRGEQAGGTKDAYIVDFHDTWDKYNFWLDPQQLDIFDNGEIEIVTPKLEEIEIVDNECGDDEPQLPLNLILPDFNLRDVYMKIYHSMKVSLTIEIGKIIIPCGWYSVISKIGDEMKVLVYESQLKGYQNMDKQKHILIKERYSANRVISLFFKDVKGLSSEEIKSILDMLYESHEMPIYYDFEQRNLVDPKLLLTKINEMFDKDEDKELWLKEYFDKTPIVKEIYKYFYAFKKTVFDAGKIITEAIIKTDDDREKYNVVENYYNIGELLEEVLAEHQFLNKENLLEIRWSDVVVKRWFAICHSYIKTDTNETVYRIFINKVLSSPQVDKEVIKFLIYHELIHKIGYWNHDAEFRELEWAYPNSDELDGFLYETTLRYNMEMEYSTAKYDYEHPWESENEDLQSIPTEDAVDSNNQNDDNNKNQEDGHKDTPLEEKISDISSYLETIKDYKFCRNCGNKLPADAMFCDKCGSKTEY